MDILVAGWLLKGFEVSNEFFEIFLREKWREIVVNLGKNNEKLTILKEKSTLMSTKLTNKMTTGWNKIDEAMRTLTGHVSTYWGPNMVQNGQKW